MKMKQPVLAAWSMLALSDSKAKQREFKAFVTGYSCCLSLAIQISALLAFLTPTVSQCDQNYDSQLHTSSPFASSISTRFQKNG